jgi:hypothetical protein
MGDPFGRNLRRIGTIVIIDAWPRRARPPARGVL